MTVEGLTLVYIIICAFIPFMYSLIHSSYLYKPVTFY